MGADSTVFYIAAFIVIIITLAAWPWIKNPQTREKSIVFSLVGALLSLALYMFVGSPYQQEHIEDKQHNNTELIGQITQLSDALSMAEAPDDPSYASQWIKLGAAHMQLEQYDAAAEAFRHAVLASEGQPEIILVYGKAQLLAADGVLTPSAEHSLKMASRLMPDNPEPMMLIAMGHMQNGETDAAREMFKKLLPLLPESAPLRQRLMQQMPEE
ncbi:MAG: hypothetical protein MK052_00450 [Alphaproteobacteria bacterium]|nr:hypothetical protein [Alphaproteobacteria bacterium]